MAFEADKQQRDMTKGITGGVMTALRGINKKQDMDSVKISNNIANVNINTIKTVKALNSLNKDITKLVAMQKSFINYTKEHDQSFKKMFVRFFNQMAIDAKNAKKSIMKTILGVATFFTGFLVGFLKDQIITTWNDIKWLISKISKIETGNIFKSVKIKVVGWLKKINFFISLIGQKVLKMFKGGIKGGSSFLGKIVKGIGSIIWKSLTMFGGLLSKGMMGLVRKYIPFLENYLLKVGSIFKGGGGKGTKAIGFLGKVYNFIVNSAIKIKGFLMKFKFIATIVNYVKKFGVGIRTVFKWISILQAPFFFLGKLVGFVVSKLLMPIMVTYEIIRGLVVGKGWKDKILEVLSGLISMFTFVPRDMVKLWLTSVIEWFHDIFTWDKDKGLLGNAADWARNLYTWVKGLIKDAIAYWGEIFTWDNIKGWLGSAWDIAYEYIFQPLSLMLSDLWKWFKELVHWDTIVKAVGNVLHNITDPIKNMFQSIASFIETDIVNPIMKVIDDVGKWVSDKLGFLTKFFDDENEKIAAKQRKLEAEKYKREVAEAKKRGVSDTNIENLRILENQVKALVKKEITDKEFKETKNAILDKLGLTADERHRIEFILKEKLKYERANIPGQIDVDARANALGRIKKLSQAGLEIGTENKAAEEFFERGNNPGSIYTHDIHVERKLENISTYFREMYFPNMHTMFTMMYDKGGVVQKFWTEAYKEKGFVGKLFMGEHIRNEKGDIIGRTGLLGAMAGEHAYINDARGGKVLSVGGGGGQSAFYGASSGGVGDQNTTSGTGQTQTTTGSGLSGAGIDFTTVGGVPMFGGDYAVGNTPMITESGGDPGITNDRMMALGRDPKGGWSYGLFQMASGAGTPQAFAKQYGSKFGITANDATAGPSGKFYHQWKAAAKNDPVGFSKAHRDFIVPRYLNPGLEYLGVSRNDIPLAVQDAIMHPYLGGGNGLGNATLNTALANGFNKNATTYEEWQKNLKIIQLAHLENSKGKYDAENFNTISTRLQNEVWPAERAILEAEFNGTLNTKQRTKFSKAGGVTNTSGSMGNIADPSPKSPPSSASSLTAGSNTFTSGGGLSGLTQSSVGRGQTNTGVTSSGITAGASNTGLTGSLNSLTSSPNLSGGGQNKNVDTTIIDTGQYFLQNSNEVTRGQRSQLSKEFDPTHGVGPVTSGWNKKRSYGSSPHKGVDIGVPIGTPLFALGKGVVSAIKYSNSGYGNQVYVDYGKGVQVSYNHLSKALVKKGQSVNLGDKIALSGNTGKSTGPHLHISGYINGTQANPMQVAKLLQDHNGDLGDATIRSGSLGNTADPEPVGPANYNGNANTASTTGGTSGSGQTTGGLSLSDIAYFDKYGSLPGSSSTTGSSGLSSFYGLLGDYGQAAYFADQLLFGGKVGGTILDFVNGLFGGSSDSSTSGSSGGLLGNLFGGLFGGNGKGKTTGGGGSVEGTINNAISRYTGGGSIVGSGQTQTGATNLGPDGLTPGSLLQDGPDGLLPGDIGPYGSGQTTAGTMTSGTAGLIFFSEFPKGHKPGDQNGGGKKTGWVLPDPDVGNVGYWFKGGPMFDLYLQDAGLEYTGQKIKGPDGKMYPVLRKISKGQRQFNRSIGSAKKYLKGGMKASKSPLADAIDRTDGLSGRFGKYSEKTSQEIISNKDDSGKVGNVIAPVTYNFNMGDSGLENTAGLSSLFNSMNMMLA